MYLRVPTSLAGVFEKAWFSQHLKISLYQKIDNGTILSL